MGMCDLEGQVVTLVNECGYLGIDSMTDATFGHFSQIKLTPQKDDMFLFKCWYSKLSKGKSIDMTT